MNSRSESVSRFRGSLAYSLAVGTTQELQGTAGESRGHVAALVAGTARGLTGDVVDVRSALERLCLPAGFYSVHSGSGIRSSRCTWYALVLPLCAGDCFGIDVVLSGLGCYRFPVLRTSATFASALGSRCDVRGSMLESGLDGLVAPNPPPLGRVGRIPLGHSFIHPPV